MQQKIKAAKRSPQVQVLIKFAAVFLLVFLLVSCKAEPKADPIPAAEGAGHNVDLRAKAKTSSETIATTESK